MSCDACGAEEATVAYAEIVDGVLSTWRLCDECARKRGVGGSLSSLAGPLANVLSGLLGDDFVESDEGQACPACGRTYGTFRRTGRLGCARCYEVFSDELRPLIRRIHGTTEHVGCVPADHASRHSIDKKVRELKMRLHAAVRAEEYESAALLRDRIAELEREVSPTVGRSCGPGIPEDLGLLRGPEQRRSENAPGEDEDEAQAGE
jgi:protein arginine kinase activator